MSKVKKQRVHHLKRIIVFIAILISGVCLLTACSFVPKKSNAKTAEKYAKQYINEQVSLVDKKGDSQNDSYRMRTIYHLKDVRNIDFDVRVDDNFVSFVDAIIPYLYTNKMIFTTDYRTKVMDYYSKDIERIISELKLEKTYTSTPNNANLRVSVSEEESLENIAEAIMKIDDLLDYDYKLSSEVTRKMAEKDIVWENGMDGTIHIEMSNSDGKRLLYLTFEFSDGNTHILTYEKVLRTLKAEMMQRQSDENLLFVYINDKLFYGPDKLYRGETSDDATLYDGKMDKFSQTIPQKNGYGNVGAGTPYMFGTGGEVYVYMPDGCRVLYEFTE